MWPSCYLAMLSYCYLLLEGQKIDLEVHPGLVITSDYSQQDGTMVYAVMGQDEEDKLLALQKILEEESYK